MTNRTWPSVEATEVPWIDTATMIEVDRLMIEDFHIELIQMMENAGRNLAEVVTGLYQPSSAAVYVGSGGNGGGGLVAARHLANRGVDVSVVLAKPREAFGTVPAHQLDVIERMGLVVAESSTGASVDVVVDALIGYSLHSAPRGAVAEHIDSIMNKMGSGAIVSLDVPSGVDSTTGATPGAAIAADATLTLAIPKRGLRSNRFVGRLLVGDISVPGDVYRSLGLHVGPLFARGPIVEIREDARRS